MDTLSSPVTTFQVPKPFNPNHHNHLKPTPFPHHNHPSSTTRTTTATSSISTLQQKDKSTPLNAYYVTKTSPLLPPINRNSSPARASIHRRAASGYAAALLNVTQRNGTALKVEKDVRRLLRVFRNGEFREFMMDDMVVEKEKGEVIKQLMEKGKFEKSLVGLVKMVVEKGNKVEVVKEVLEEFVRVFSQLAANHNASPTTLAMGKY